MHESRLIVLQGNTRSGKSTYANRWAREDIMRVVINSDSLRLALTGQRYNYLAESVVFSMKYVFIRALLKQGYTCLVDGTNSSDISIQRILEIDPKAEFVLIDTPTEVCIKRAIDTHQEDLIPVIERIGKNIERIKAVGIENIRKEILETIKNRNCS